MNPINIISLFSGYDSPLVALDNLDIPYNLLCWSEIDPYAIEAHNILHPQLKSLNVGDIQAARPPSRDIDILFYSSPCQDFSKAGLNKGGAKGSNTRSSLLWHVEKFIRATRPRFLIMENVPTLATVHYRDLEEWIMTLQRLGYHSVKYIINALHCGIPQDRKRLFVISSLENPPLIMQPTINPLPPLSFLDSNQAPKHLYIDTHKISNKEILTSEYYPYILGYTRVYHDPCKSSYHKKKYFNTITTKNVFPPCNLIVESSMQVRRLSPAERLRLMGLTPQQTNSLLEYISETQLNKLAGNSICIPVLEHLFNSILVSINN